MTHITSACNIQPDADDDIGKNLPPQVEEVFENPKGVRSFEPIPYVIVEFDDLSPNGGI